MMKTTTLLYLFIVIFDYVSFQLVILIDYKFLERVVSLPMKLVRTKFFIFTLKNKQESRN